MEILDSALSLSRLSLSHCNWLYLVTKINTHRSQVSTEHLQDITVRARCLCVDVFDTDWVDMIREVVEVVEVRHCDVG